MKIHTNSRDRLIARLDKADMQRYDVGFCSLDINDANTVRLINDLLTLAGISLRGNVGRLNIDAMFPDENEMLVILTLKRGAVCRHRRMRVKGIRNFCILFSKEALFGLCDALAEYRGVITESRLYSCGETYAVEICQKALDKNNLKCILSEFGRVQSSTSSIRHAHICEHCQLICRDFIARLSL